GGSRRRLPPERVEDQGRASVACLAKRLDEIPFERHFGVSIELPECSAVSAGGDDPSRAEDPRGLYGYVPDGSRRAEHEDHVVLPYWDAPGQRCPAGHARDSHRGGDRRIRIVGDGR